MVRVTVRRDCVAWVAALVLAAGSLAAAAAEEPARPLPVDVVLCLDTSNSMDGLIAAAKARLWDLVNDLSRARPTPALRVALYSYGNNAYDPAAGWVRPEVGLTADLDQVAEKLTRLAATTRPGSDEYVGRVCRDALRDLAWSADPKALKILFVCGNESAEQDPQVPLPPLAEQAVRQGVIINTIFCGAPTDPDAAGWKRFADLAEGRFMAIDQNRAQVAVPTPFDRELAELGTKINGTFLFYGREAGRLRANQERQDATAAGLGGGTAASRALTKGGDLYQFPGRDLVGQLKQDKAFDVKKVPAEDLPEELRKLTPEAREKRVQELAAQRDDLQKRMAELGAKREAFLQTAAAEDGATRTFGEAVRAVVKEQARKKGLELAR